MAPEDSSLVNFYGGTARDARGRTLADLWAWDDTNLEQVHDYIQWLFPVPEPSQFNDEAPRLTPDDIAAFAARADLRDNLRHSFARILAFYGLTLGAGPVVTQADNFSLQAVNWLRPYDHNFLRITRILRSLTLLGLGAEARAFLAALEDIDRDHGGGTIGERSFAFWRWAVTPGAAAAPPV
jgi:Opioid growth factor receptor (OGFr) conserved region